MLWCEDWSCLALDAFGGDLKAIGAYYSILAHAVKAMAEALKMDVEVKWQSVEILKDPNMYWISVIDAGRQKRPGGEPMIGLEEVEQHLPAGEALSESGQVVVPRKEAKENEVHSESKKKREKYIKKHLKRLEKT